MNKNLFKILGLVLIIIGLAPYLYVMGGLIKSIKFPLPNGILISGGSFLFIALLLFLPFFPFVGSGLFFWRSADRIQTNRKMIIAHIIHIVGLLFFIFGIWRGYADCTWGPLDGLCILIGIFIAIPALLVWAVGLTMSKRATLKNQG